MILALWVIWFVRAEIVRYEVAETARLESESAGYDLQTPVAGRVVVSRLALGRRVHAGEDDVVFAELVGRVRRWPLAWPKAARRKARGG